MSGREAWDQCGAARVESKLCSSAELVVFPLTVTESEPSEADSGTGPRPALQNLDPRSKPGTAPLGLSLTPLYWPLVFSSLRLSQPRRCMATDRRQWAANQLKAASSVMASRQRNSVRILSSRERGSQSFGSQRLLQLLVEEKVRWMKWQSQKVELPDSPRSTFLLAFSPDRW